MLRSRRTGISLNWRPRLDRTDSSASPSPGLTAIDDKPSEFFADWLVVGIRFDLFGPDMMRAFPGAQRYVGKRDLLVDDLAAIWRMLAPDTQLAFANGAADGLKRLDFADRGDALVARELLSLAGRIRAHAVLAMFARCSNQGFATAPGGELLSMAVDLIADLATHDDAVAAADRRMLARRGIDATQPVIALAAGQPSHHLDIDDRPECLAAHGEIILDAADTEVQHHHIAGLVSVRPEGSYLIA